MFHWARAQSSLGFLSKCPDVQPGVTGSDITPPRVISHLNFRIKVDPHLDPCLFWVAVDLDGTSGRPVQQPFSLLVSTFAAKLLHLFLFIAVIGSLPCVAD